MTTINAATIYAEVLAHRLALAQTIAELEPDYLPAYARLAGTKTELYLGDAVKRAVPSLVTIKTSARGSMRIANTLYRLDAFAAIVKSKAAIFGGGFAKAERKAKPLVTWSTAAIKVACEAMQDNDYAGAVQIAEEKLGGFFVVQSIRAHNKNKPRAVLCIAPMPVNGMPDNFVSARVVNGDYQVFDLSSGFTVSFSEKARSRAEAAAIEKWASVTPEKQNDILANAKKRDPVTARAQWFAEYELSEKSEIEHFAALAKMQLEEFDAAESARIEREKLEKLEEAAKHLLTVRNYCKTGQLGKLSRAELLEKALERRIARQKSAAQSKAYDVAVQAKKNHAQLQTEGSRIRKAAQAMQAKGLPEIAAKYEALALSHDLKDERAECVAAADVTMAQAVAVIAQVQALPAIEALELAIVCEGEASEGKTANILPGDRVRVEITRIKQSFPKDKYGQFTPAGRRMIDTLNGINDDSGYRPFITEVIDGEVEISSSYFGDGMKSLRVPLASVISKTSKIPPSNTSIAPVQSAQPAIETVADYAPDFSAAMQAGDQDRRITTYSQINRNDCFQFSKSGPVFVKCSGGYRPGRGGELVTCNPGAAVWFYDPCMMQASEPAQPAAQVGGGEVCPFKIETIPAASPAAYAADISLALAVSAYNGTSFSPERRGASAQREYAQSMTADYEAMHAQAIKGGTLDKLPEVFARYNARQARAYRAYLASSARCVSSFIVGPSNFPVARMNKRADITHKRLTEYLDGGELAKRAAMRTLRPDLRPIMAGDTDAADRLAAKIASAERNQNAMKAANKAIRAHAKAGEAHQVAALLELGFLEADALDLLRPRFSNRQGFAPFSLTNNNANIRRMVERLAQIEKAQAREVIEVDGINGVKLEDNAPANRVRLFFPGKPPVEIRTTLKAAGFRWTPSLGAWQAYRNNSTLQTTREMAGTATPGAPAPTIEAPAIEAPAKILAPIACEIPAIEQNPARLPDIIEVTRNDGLAHRCPSRNKQKAAGKSGAWTAELYKNAAGTFVLQFMGLIYGLSWTFYSTAGERIRALQVMARDADTPAPVAPAEALKAPAAPAEDSTSPAPVNPPADRGVGGVARSNLESSPAFARCKPFNFDPRELLTDGVTAGQLVGLGVKYTGNMANPSGEGAITEVNDTRGEKWGALRITCTLEDGRTVNAEPHYFTASLRPILQFNSKHHGTPYLAELAAAAMLKKSSESSAAELASQAHAKALAALPLEFPHLKQYEQGGKLTGCTLAAANMRAMFKQAFPGVKFSVKSSSFSMGNSITITWIDGPTSAQVVAITDRFSGGDFDSMTDSYEYSSTAFTSLFGKSKYIHTRRELSDSLIQAAIEQHYAGQAEKPSISDYRQASGRFSWSTWGNDSNRHEFDKTVNAMNP